MRSFSSAPVYVPHLQQEIYISASRFHSGRNMLVYGAIEKTRLMRKKNHPCGWMIGSDPGRTRTFNQLIKSQLLCQIELRGQRWQLYQAATRRQSRIKSCRVSTVSRAKRWPISILSPNNYRMFFILP